MAVSYGGANYNTADSDLKKKLVDSRLKEQNDDSYRQSEIARTLQVIKDRQSQGLDVSAQQKYLNTNLGYQAPKPSVPTPGAALSNMTTPNVQAPRNNNAQVGSDIMNQLRELAQRQSQPFSYDPNNDPAYQAALQRARSNIEQGNAAAQAEMNRRGILNSTITSDRMGEISANEMGRVETDVLPQLMQAAYQRYQNEQAQQQQQFANLANMAQMYLNEDQRGIDNTFARADRTGYLPMDDSAQQYINAILQLKQQAESPGITAAERSQLSKQADTYRSVLASMGVDPNAFGSNVSFNQASAVPMMMSRTLQGQQFDNQLKQQQWENDFAKQQFAYQQARDQIKDRQFQQQFDEDVRRFGLQYGLNRQVQLGGLSIDQARLLLAQDDNARQWAALDYEMSMPSSSRSGLTANQVLQSIKSLYTDPVFQGEGLMQQKVGEQITQDPTKREQMFLNVVDSGLSDLETMQILNSLGMGKSEIDKYMKKYGATSGN